jgi:hypothetical protein
VDGQSGASVTGTLDGLCRAAEATKDRYVPLPAFNYKGAYNLYLPIYFSHGIRIEIEATNAVDEFYTQIDYRLDSEVRPHARLVSEEASAGLTLKYVGEYVPAHREDKLRHLDTKSVNLQYGPTSKDNEFVIEGPGILRKVTFRGDALSDLQVEIYWDNAESPSVRAPLQYFFADFVNAAMESKPGEMTCYFPMPFHEKARIVLRSQSASIGRVSVEYALERIPVPKTAPYFHADYHDMEKSLGYSQYSVLRVRGQGLFVGANLFDTGHNHGGGDSALIDAGTADPHVLHGICGEDYFAFAWHHTGAMTLLTGAPVHERRYRLHLENPYPFHESFQFLFGVFAGQHPKSVAFWYQSPESNSQTEWLAPDISWKVLGPLGLQTPVPERVSEQTYKTAVVFKDATPLQERWQDAQMTAGFLDLTYHFRHYVFTESGTGYVAGPSRVKLTTYIYSPLSRTADAVLGHDDGVVVQINGRNLSRLTWHPGFGSSRLNIPLRQGWNKFDVVLSNEENTNWRWSGVSLALEQSQSQGLRFSAKAQRANLK